MRKCGYFDFLLINKPALFDYETFNFISIILTYITHQLTKQEHDVMKPDMECLLVLDSRTAKSFKIPIQDNFIQATDIGKITISDADNDKEDASVQTARPLRVLDRGFENTACMVSSITVMYAMFSLT